MRLGQAFCTALAVVLSGCSAPNADDAASTIDGSPDTGCPADPLRREVYAAAETFAEERLLVDVAGTVRMEGTMEGEVGAFTIALRPDAKALRVSGPGLEVRVVEPFYSLDMEEDGERVQGYGRDHRPGSSYDEFLDEFASDDEPSFTDDLTVDDYSATCRTQGGVEVIEYRYEKDGRKDVNVAERGGAHRPLSGEVVDPALQDNFRVSVSYEVPSIAVDDSLDRLPVTWGFDVIDNRQNARGGLYLSGTMDDATEWAPLAELEVHLVDQADGTVYFTEALSSKTYDMADGDLFRYTDQDRNGKLSKGDTFLMDLGPGLDVSLFDKWADQYVPVEA